MMQINKSNQVNNKIQNKKNKNDLFVFINKESINEYISQEKVIKYAISQISPETYYEEENIRNKIQSEWFLFDEHERMKLSKKDFVTCGIMDFLVELISDNDNSRALDTAELKSISSTNIDWSPPCLRENASDWFEFYKDRISNSLSKSQIVNGLFDKMMFQMNDENCEIINNRIDKLWGKYSSNEEIITKKEFLGNNEDSLVKCLIELFQEYSSSESVGEPKARTLKRTSYLPPPSLSKDARIWFQHFDHNKSGQLSVRELTYALFVSFNAVSKGFQSAIKKKVKLNWTKFDKNGTGTISMEDFLTPYDPSLRSFAEILMELEPDIKTSPVIDRPVDDKQDIAIVKINIPLGMEPFNLIQVVSPKTKELVMLSLPPKTKWGGSGDLEDPHYFTVKF